MKEPTKPASVESADGFNAMVAQNRRWVALLRREADSIERFTTRLQAEAESREVNA